MNLIKMIFSNEYLEELLLAQSLLTLYGRSHAFKAIYLLISLQWPESQPITQSVSQEIQFPLCT